MTVREPDLNRPRPAGTVIRAPTDSYYADEWVQTLRAEGRWNRQDADRS